MEPNPRLDSSRTSDALSRPTRGYNFHRWALQRGLTQRLPKEFPGTLNCWKDAPLTLDPGSTYYGFVYTGRARLQVPNGEFTLSKGMYFSVVGEARISGGSGIAIGRNAHHGVFHVGGPVEERGRLRYIDGCTDSLLLPPTMLGDPCLNLLHIPEKTKQSCHTHASYRAGLVIEGRGECLLDRKNRIPLAPGDSFLIGSGQVHSFHTSDLALRVIAYHPDSDTGPTHQDHPMINRTQVTQ